MYDRYGTSNIEPHGRHCIALKMEMILQQLGLANLLRRFEDERVLPPPQALNNKANMIFDAHTVDIEISAGEENY